MSESTLETPTDPPTQPHTLERPKSPMSPGGSPTTSWEKVALTNSDTSILDLELLCKQLCEHNSRNEAAWALLRQQHRSVSSKQAHDVAAAARFRLRLDQTGPEGVQEPVSPTMRSKTEYPQRLRRSLSTETMSSMMGNRLARTKDSQSTLRRRKVTRPPPLRLDSLSTHPQEIQSAALPVRSSSKHAMQDYFYRKEEMPPQRRATVAGTERDSQRSNDQFPPRTASKAAVLTHTVQAPPPSAAAVAAPANKPIPLAVVVSTNKPPCTPSSPTEDQLRREIERSLSESKDKTRGEQRRSRKLAQMLSAEVRNELTRTATITAATTTATTVTTSKQESPEAITTSTTITSAPATPASPLTVASTTSIASSVKETIVPQATPVSSETTEPSTTRRTPSPPVEELTSDASPTDASVPSSKSSLSRKKSLFGWLQKKSEVDELIELYMSDEQLEEPKRRPSKARLGIFRSKSSGQMGGSEET